MDDNTRSSLPSDVVIIGDRIICLVERLTESEGIIMPHQLDQDTTLNTKVTIVLKGTGQSCDLLEIGDQVYLGPNHAVAEFRRGSNKYIIFPAFEVMAVMRKVN